MNTPTVRNPAGTALVLTAVIDDLASILRSQDVNEATQSSLKDIRHRLQGVLDHPGTKEN